MLSGLLYTRPRALSRRILHLKNGWPETGATSGGRNSGSFEGASGYGGGVLCYNIWKVGE